MIWLLGLAGENDLDALEFFAGQQAVTNGFAAAGYRSLAFEVLRDAIGVQTIDLFHDHRPRDHNNQEPLL